MKPRMKSLALLASMMGLVMIFSAGRANGQATSTADVTGTVSDPTGAVIPGVTVTVKDTDKGIVHTFVTNAAGIYDTGPLTPEDHYTITFTRDGFSSLQRDPCCCRSVK